jgi:hypothetical protein
LLPLLVRQDRTLAHPVPSCYVCLCVKASGIDQSLGALGISEEKKDRHPEKRMKAAFNAYKVLQLQSHF